MSDDICPIDEVILFISKNKRNGVNQGRIADLAGLNKNTVSATLLRKRVPNYQTLLQIQKAVEIIKKEIAENEA